MYFEIFVGSGMRSKDKKDFIKTLFPLNSNKKLRNNE